MNSESSYTLNERMRALIDASTCASRRYQDLEDRTGVSASTWKTFYNRGTRPSADLLEALAKTFPVYSEWLLTGQCGSAAQRQLSVLIDNNLLANDEL